MNLQEAQIEADKLCQHSGCIGTIGVVYPITLNGEPAVTIMCACGDKSQTVTLDPGSEPAGYYTSILGGQGQKMDQELAMTATHTAELERAARMHQHLDGAALRVPLRANGTAGWFPDLSDPRNTIQQLGPIKGKAGGYKSTTGSIFSRMSLWLPERFDLAPSKAVRLCGEFELVQPIEFYVAIARTDNYVGKFKSSGKAVGCGTGSEHRMQLVFYADGRLRLQSAHQGGETITHWTSPDPLAVGRHTFDARIFPEVTALGAWSMRLDDGQPDGAGYVKTMPATVPAAERVVTRVRALIDGADKWVTKPLELWMHWLDVELEL